MSADGTEILDAVRTACDALIDAADAHDGLFPGVLTTTTARSRGGSGTGSNGPSPAPATDSSTVSTTTGGAIAGRPTTATTSSRIGPGSKHH